MSLSSLSWRPSSFFLLLLQVLALDALLSFSSSRVHALRLELSGQIGQPSRSAQRLRRRGNLVGDIPVGDLSDVTYSVNITVGGSPFNVQIDTGSSDLWVATSSLSGSTSTGNTASVQYAIGQISGPVVTDSVTFAGQTVDDQALILVQPSGTNPANKGLIGLGPNSGSHVAAAVSGSTGNPILQNIFEQGARPYLTVALGREADPAAPQPGDLTVGEVLANQSAVLKQPQLPMAVVGSGFGSENQHWQTLLDADGIIGPDGKVIPYKSQVPGSTTPDQLNVVFDTGFTLPQVPLAVASEIYGRVPGASFQNVSGVGEAWTIPCDYELNIAFKFGGVEFPIHPLDTSMQFGGVTGADGQPACLGAFQPIQSGADEATFDMILGMAFLRNVYLLVNFGNMANTTSTTVSGGTNPYMQLLSTTDLSTAHQQFVDTRLGGKDTTSTQSLLAASVIPASLLTTPAPLATPTAAATLGAVVDPASITAAAASTSTSPPAPSSSSTPAPTSTSSASDASATAVGAASQDGSSNRSFIDQVKTFFTTKSNFKYILIGAGCIGALLILLISLCIFSSVRRRRRRMERAFNQLP